MSTKFKICLLVHRQQEYCSGCSSSNNNYYYDCGIGAKHGKGAARASKRHLGAVSE
jgi:hypothetical protein